MQFTDAMEAGFLIGVMLFAPVAGVRLLLEFIRDAKRPGRRSDD